MSVLIKGMQMPHFCYDCPLEYNQCACSVTGTRWYSTIPMRLYNCPLVELPEHHGRLIDEDEIEIPSLETVNDQYLVFDAIKDAPTVFEAE